MCKSVLTPYDLNVSKTHWNPLIKLNIKYISHYIDCDMPLLIYLQYLRINLNIYVQILNHRSTRSWGLKGHSADCAHEVTSCLHLLPTHRPGNELALWHTQPFMCCRVCAACTIKILNRWREAPCLLPSHSHRYGAEVFRVLRCHASHLALACRLHRGSGQGHFHSCRPLSVCRFNRYDLPDEMLKRKQTLKKTWEALPMIWENLVESTTKSGDLNGHFCKHYNLQLKERKSRHFLQNILQVSVVLQLS